MFGVCFRSFCESYDMKTHSTKIFRDIVNGLGAFIQSQFVTAQVNTTTQTGIVKGDRQVQISACSLLSVLYVHVKVRQTCFASQGNRL